MITPWATVRVTKWDVSGASRRQGSSQIAGGVPAVLLRVAGKKAVRDESGSAHRADLSYRELAGKQEIFHREPWKPGRVDEDRIQRAGSGSGLGDGRAGQDPVAAGDAARAGDRESERSAIRL